MPPTCIVVEDESHTLNEICLMIEQSGMARVVGKFTSPLEALKAIPVLKPDFVISDMEMPALKGFEMARICQDSYPCKFIFITGHANFVLESFTVDVIH